MKKNRVYFWIEDNCLAWRIETKTGNQQFGASLHDSPQGKVLRNFLWEIPACATLKELLVRIADATYAEQRGRAFLPRSHRRMGVEKVRVKPWQEESYQRMLARLGVETLMVQAPYGTQPQVGDIMRHAILNFDGGAPIKEVVPCPTSYAPHKVKVRILADDTWITLWFGYTPWALMQTSNEAQLRAML